MKQINTLIAASLLAMPAVMSAEPASWLTFRMTDQSEISVPSENLTMNYSDRVLHVVTPTVNTDLALENILSMQFTSTPTAVENISDGNLSGVKEFVTLSGMKVGEFATYDEARKTLPSGVYIVKNGDKTLKVIF